jgi:ferredoxin
VVEGIDLCEPPDASEAELLDIFGNKPGIRLACQLRIRRGAGLVRLRVTL